MINGITEGISKAIIKRLEELENIKVERSCYVSQELMDSMAQITHATGKEVSVYVSRQGDVISVSIGESDRLVSLGQLKRLASENDVRNADSIISQIVSAIQSFKRKAGELSVEGYHIDLISEFINTQVGKLKH